MPPRDRDTTGQPQSGRGATQAPAGATRSLRQTTSATEAARSHIATHGRGTSRWLAQEHGVSQRTAQRWLAGTQRPRNPAAVISGADQAQVRISALRKVRVASLGRVSVWETSPRIRSTRNIGDVEVDMSPVADLLAAGGTEEEADEMARELFMDAYFEGGYTGDIEIDGYADGDPQFY